MPGIEQPTTGCLYVWQIPYPLLYRSSFEVRNASLSLPHSLGSRIPHLQVQVGWFLSNSLGWESQLSWNHKLSVERKFWWGHLTYLKTNPSWCSALCNCFCSICLVSNICQQALLYFSFLLTACHELHSVKNTISLQKNFFSYFFRSASEGQAIDPKVCKNGNVLWM